MKLANSIFITSAILSGALGTGSSTGTTVRASSLANKGQTERLSAPGENSLRAPSLHQGSRRVAANDTSAAPGTAAPSARNASDDASQLSCNDDLSLDCLSECIDMLKNCKPVGNCNATDFHQSINDEFQTEAQEKPVDCQLEQLQRCIQSQWQYGRCESMADLHGSIADNAMPTVNPPTQTPTNEPPTQTPTNEPPTQTPTNEPPTSPSTRAPAPSSDSDNETKPKQIHQDVAMGSFALGMLGMLFLSIYSCSKNQSGELQGTQQSQTAREPDPQAEARRAARNERRVALEKMDNWSDMASVVSDAPTAEPACPISLEAYADLEEPVRIRQPDNTFTNKVFELSALKVYLKHRVRHVEGFLDPTNRQPIKVADIFREKRSATSEKSLAGKKDSSAGHNNNEHVVATAPENDLESGLASVDSRSEPMPIIQGPSRPCLTRQHSHFSV